jgi:hypothetical protein
VDGLGDKDRDMTDDFKEVADRGSRNTHTKEIKCSPMRSGRRFGVNFKLRDMGPFFPSLLGITGQLSVCGDNLLKIQCFSLAAGAKDALFHPPGLSSVKLGGGRAQGNPSLGTDNRGLI